jgi:hypothetical protein
MAGSFLHLLGQIRSSNGRLVRRQHPTPGVELGSRVAVEFANHRPALAGVVRQQGIGEIPEKRLVRLAQRASLTIEIVARAWYLLQVPVHVRPHRSSSSRPSNAGQWAVCCRAGPDDNRGW